MTNWTMKIGKILMKETKKMTINTALWKMTMMVNISWKKRNLNLMTAIASWKERNLKLTTIIDLLKKKSEMMLMTLDISLKEMGLTPMTALKERNLTPMTTIDALKETTGWIVKN